MSARGRHLSEQAASQIDTLIGHLKRIGEKGSLAPARAAPSSATGP